MQRPRTVIDADNTGTGYWRDIWSFRGLFYFLAWRDILVRYKQTAIGVVWALLRPAIVIAAFTFFGAIYDTDTQGVPRILLVAAATLPWQLFSSALGDSANSMVANANMITKVYFPRLIIPLSAILVCVVDFFLTLLIFLVLMFAFGYLPGWPFLFVPLLVALTLISATGIGLILAALNVKFRDFRYLLPFIIQLGVFVSPIAFTSSDVYGNPDLPEGLKMLYSLNPMVMVIEGIRWSLLGIPFSMETRYLVVSLAVSISSLMLGMWYFRKTERGFADII